MVMEWIYLQYGDNLMVPIRYAITLIMIRYIEFSKSSDVGLDLQYRSEILQLSRWYCSPGSCKTSQRHDNTNP